MKKTLFLFAIFVCAAAFSFAGEGCDHAKAATQTAGAHECSHEGSSEPGCPMKGHELVETKEVSVEGKLLCRHCNLKETKTCEKVFVTAENARYSVCPKSDMNAAEGVSKHGQADIVVTGKVMKAKDGLEVLVIETARAKS